MLGSGGHPGRGAMYSHSFPDRPWLTGVCTMELRDVCAQLQATMGSRGVNCAWAELLTMVCIHRGLPRIETRV